MSEKNATPNPETKQKKQLDPLKMVESISKGRFQLTVPITDGEQKYDELRYDFTALTGWELASAIDMGTKPGGKSMDLSDTQALALFAAAAGKATDGLDATDIRERMGAMDSIAAIRVAQLFFNGSSLAGSLRFTNT